MLELYQQEVITENLLVSRLQRHVEQADQQSALESVAATEKESTLAEVFLVTLILFNIFYTCIGFHFCKNSLKEGD